MYVHLTADPENPRPGLIDALLTTQINGERLGPGTAGRAHAPDRRRLRHDDRPDGAFGRVAGRTPDQRERLSRERDTLLDSATEEFLRFYTPAPGDGRTIPQDCVLAGQEFKEGDRLWLSWAMANRDPSVFPNPNELDLARQGNRHLGFGLGIHRCIGSNMARMVFKRMLAGVLDRIPDYVCDPAGTVHYDSGVIQGIKHSRRRSPPASASAPAWTRPWTSSSGPATSSAWPSP